jgi:outer membrane receptor protein involved in Fe transport
MKRLLAAFTAVVVLALLGTTALYAQGVTTSSIRAVVKDPGGTPLAGARVTAVHTPSGTTYGGSTSQDGRVTIPGMRIGGPYQVTVAAIGFERQVRGEIYLTLGVATDLQFEMRQAAVGLSEIVVTAERVFSSERTGAATTVGAQAITQLPTVLGRIEDFTRLTPQARGTSFVGQDNRLNNITVDGSYFNNSFGLGGQPGDRTGVAPISMDAIEQIQVNIAPYDVRQGNFVGAGVNTVTKSGTNEFTGSVYYGWRNDGLVGTKTGDLTYDPGTFKYNKFGARFGGPIIKNKLFFFASYEDDGLTQPGTTWTANAGGEAIEGTKTRVLASDLDALSSYLQDKFDFNPGPYQGYDFQTPARRYLAKIDYNLNERNKISLRYNHLDSDTDVLMSNSSSLGFGNRRTRPDALNFQGSNYKILENIRSIVGEWNSVIGSNKSNNLIIGYNYSDESRGYVIDRLFPMVDVLKDGSTYTSFGFEPFTPNNELRYKSFQIQNNFTIYGNKHDLTFGVSGERYKSENVFFPGSQSAYVYNSLADFYTDANDYLANPNRTTSPITLRRFQVRWSNQPDLDKPLQPLEVTYVGGYAQDEWRATDNLTLTLGLRFDVPFFGNTGFVNSEVDGFTFQDETGNPAKYSTSKLPDANILFSPRFGFNWNVTGDRSTQIRGGTGIFTGRPAYVWISNQVGNNGVLTGFERLDNTKARPWNPDPNAYKPTNVTGAPASSYELAFTDPSFKFPQVWRSNIAVDQKLPWDLIFTGEFIYSKDVNGIYYINANLADPNTSFTGADDRSRWTTGNKIISKVDNAVVLKNQNEGYAWDAAASIEKAFSTGLFLKAAYSYSVSKNTVDPGSIAFGSWNNNQHAGDPNNPGLAYSSNPQGSRIFAAASYKKDFFGFGATTFSLFWQLRDQDRFSYSFSGDLNGDGGTSNDLIYIPKDKSEMNFETYSTGGVTYTAAQQADAWEAYINQDEYLRSHRGEYAERNGVKLPTVNRADFTFAQDLSAMLGGTRNTLEFRLDILNVTNLINKDWGQGQQAVQTQPLTSRGADSQGRALYRLRTDGTELLKSSFKPTNFISDVYTIQFGFRYMFN